MNVVMDACSIINLHNGGVLRCVCSIPGFNIQVGPIVGGECSDNCALAIASLHSDGDLQYLEDNELEAEGFLNFVSDNKLGDGETECILLAHLDDQSSICCDDRRGRKKAIELLGKERVLGSLRMLKIAVQHGLIEPSEAFAAYKAMCSAGAFLPTIDIDYFEE